MAVSLVKGKFLEKKHRTNQVISFHFKMDRPLAFHAGQFIQVIFDQNNLKNTELNKFLSISNAPKNEFIELTKKVSNSKFSEKLKSLKQGDIILFKGPFGNCVYEPACGKIGFIIGGIGITPVISILDDINNKGIKTDVVLLYANWTEEDIAFKEKLDYFSKKNSKIKIKHILAEIEKPKGIYSKGLIDKDFIKNEMPDYKERIIYIFGPPKMVNLLKNICLDMGINDTNLKTENFTGY